MNNDDPVFYLSWLRKLLKATGRHAAASDPLVLPPARSFMGKTKQKKKPKKTKKIRRILPLNDFPLHK